MVSRYKNKLNNELLSSLNYKRSKSEARERTAGEQREPRGNCKKDKPNKDGTTRKRADGDIESKNPFHLDRQGVSPLLRFYL